MSKSQKLKRYRIRYQQSLKGGNMKIIIASLVTLLGAINFAHAQSVPTATAAELALHRIEKLVTLNKIAPEYQSNFAQITVEVLVPTKPTDPAYRAVLSQNPGTDGLSDMVELLQDSNGKAVSNKAMVHTNSPKLVSWPQKDPVTLSELALHYLEDQYQSPNDNSKEVFIESLSSLSITQASQGGSLIGVISLKNSEDARVLIFKYTSDGKFISSELK